MHNLFAGHVKGSAQESVYVHLDASDMREEVLNKVYCINESTPELKDYYEERLRRLEEQLSQVVDYLQESRGTAIVAKRVLTGNSVEDSKT